MVLYGFVWFYMHIKYGYNMVLFISFGGSTCQLNILAICGWSVRSCVPIFCLFLVSMWFFQILSGCVSSDDELLEDYLFYPLETVGRWLSSLSSMVNQALKYRESPWLTTNRSEAPWLLVILISGAASLAISHDNCFEQMTNSNHPWRTTGNSWNPGMVDHHP